jgi:hypothetical protein
MKPNHKIPVTQSKFDLEMNRYIDTTLRLCLEEEHPKIGNLILISF